MMRLQQKTRVMRQLKPGASQVDVLEDCCLPTCLTRETEAGDCCDILERSTSSERKVSIQNVDVKDAVHDQLSVTVGERVNE
jgi:hypothetical protein